MTKPLLDNYWFSGLLLSAIVLAAVFAFRLYWRYRLTPEIAMTLPLANDRGAASGAAAALTVGALALMVLMFKLFGR